jgi:hypothetical protein
MRGTAMTESRLNKLLTRADLQQEFELLADGCRKMARQNAAEAFERLAVSSPSIPADVFAEHIQLFDDLRARDCYDEMVLSIGFDYFPESAERFIRDFIARQTNPV